MDADPPNPRPLTLSRLLLRGFAKRCPLCGGGDLFRGWFTMRDRCPRCAFPLERVEGHWLGALGMNTVVSFTALLATVVIGFVVTYPDSPTGLLMAIALAVAVVVPLLFFPFSKTLWSAIDLAMRPVEPDDDVDPAWLPPARHHER
ncbi:MAG TPA: DUF983 domain-containing protein [Acidimicrobiales bacterium]|nr:DUF983 domain-containing protein [Acidimicrobiales bacterium]